MNHFRRAEYIFWGEVGHNVKLYGLELSISLSALWDVRLEIALGNSHVMARHVDGCVLVASTVSSDIVTCTLKAAIYGLHS
jgi:hypothetical protein